MLKKIILFVFSLLILNFSFIALHYYADLRPIKLVKDHIIHGWKTGNLSDHNYTTFDFGYPSLFWNIGIDHVTDCGIDLMALYRSEDRLKNAIIPGFYKQPGPNQYCKTRLAIATDSINEDDLVFRTKARLWHGAKVFLLFSLPRIKYFQINHLLKLSTYLVYGLIGILIALSVRSMVLPYLPIMISGIIGSGVTAHGGYSNALPYLWSITGVCIILILNLGFLKKYIPLFTMIMGSILAFFYVTDGSLMLAVPMLAFASYFILDQDQHRVARLKNMLGLIVLLMIGFAGSLIFKQIISSLYQANALEVFWNKIIYRISGEHEFRDTSAMVSILSQLKWYHVATLGWKDYAHYMKLFGLISWLASLILVIAYYFKYKSISPLLDWCVFLIGPLIVFSRYAIMANHSVLHVIIVSRYQFIAISFGIAALIYLLMYFYSEYKSASQNLQNPEYQAS